MIVRGLWEQLEMKRQKKQTPVGESKLAQFVLERLPDDFLLTQSDLIGLDLCSTQLTRDPTPSNVVRAVKRACWYSDIQTYCDPYELLIEAGICDPNLEVLAPTAK